MSDAANPTPAAAPRRNLGWIFYFAFLIIASVSVTVWMIYFNLSIQLTPEQLSAAQARWKEKGPRDYKLFYTKRINDDTKPITIAVTVRDRKVTDVRMNGKALESEKDHSMDGLFADAERFGLEDRQPGAKKVYTIARFDDKTGAMLYFVRRVMGGNERIEIDVKTDWMEK